MSILIVCWAHTLYIKQSHKILLQLNDQNTSSSKEIPNVHEANRLFSFAFPWNTYIVLVLFLKVDMC